LLIAAVCFGVLMFSRPEGEMPGASFFVRYMAAFATVFLFFLQLRVADEFKDFEDDRRCRPQRPVPRGLVRLAELKAVAAAAAIVQVILALAMSPRLLLPLFIVWAYMLLMTREFFAPAWLKRRALAYLFSHALVLPLIYFYASACGWFAAGRPPPGGLCFLLAFGFFCGLMVEIGRKVWAPADEIPGVQTYSRLWGYRAAARAWACVGLAATVLGLLAADRSGSAAPLLGLVLVLGAAGFPTVQRFLALGLRRDAEGIERWSGLFTLTTHVGLGLTAWVYR
jgi:4-hydroxybenzoate polyprenyltransferase